MCMKKMCMEKRIFFAVFALVFLFNSVLSPIPVQAATGVFANPANNTIFVNPTSVTAGLATTVTATGDRQDAVGTTLGDERYIPTVWISSETSINETFTLSGGSYTSSYTPSSAGTYNVVATFQKQTWDGSTWIDVSGSTDSKNTTLTVTAASTPTAADAANNTVFVNPTSVTAGLATTVTATGDRQSVAGEVYGDERYVPTTWTSDEAGKSGSFTVIGSVYTSDYTTSSAGSYTITATFQKQTWDGSAWNDVSGSTDTKTTTLTVYALTLTCTAATTKTASFSFAAPSGATGVVLRKSADGGSTWTAADTAEPLSESSVSAIATGLSAGTSYKFKLEVTGGVYAGNSNAVDVSTYSITAGTLSGLNQGDTLKFGGTTWIVLNPGTGYLMLQGLAVDNKVFDSGVDAVFDPLSTTNAAYYINNDFYNSLPEVDRNLVQIHSWTTGRETGEASSMVDCKVGLISYSEFMAYKNVANIYNTTFYYWTRTPAGSGMWVVFPGGGLNPNAADYGANALRPTLYIAPSTLISGSGGSGDPYIVGADAASITAYVIPGQASASVIDAAAHTVAVTMPAGTGVTGLIATFSLPSGASATIDTVAQTSGTTANDYTTPRQYVVTAQNGETVTWTVTVTVMPAMANALNNTVSTSPASITVGGSTTITAAGDRQSAAGSVTGDERYVPTTWTSDEAGKSGSFTVTGSVYTSDYTPSSAGSYTVTAAFQKQIWNGTEWTTAEEPRVTKAASLTVTAASTPTAANAVYNTVSVNPASVTAGSPTTITAAGDRQSAAGSVTGDERYVPTTWTSDEGKNGSFTVTGSVYTSDYTPSSAGSYTITAAFQKQIWNGAEWTIAEEPRDTKTATLTVTEAVIPTAANAANNSTSVSPTSVTAGSSTTITAAGDRQSVAGAVYGDERYVPTTWTSTEAGKNGTFTLSGGSYTSSYTPSSAGSYTITATFQKQTWNGSTWNNAAGSTDAKTVVLTVNSSGGGNGGGGSTGNATSAETSQTGLGSSTVENGAATATVDSAKLAEKISGNKPGDTIVFAINGDVNKADFNLTVADLKAIADNRSMLQLESPMGIYKLPATEIDFDSISKQYPNIGYKDIKVTVAFSKANGNTAILNGSTLVGQPVSITVSITAGAKVIELDEFTKYVERDLPVPDGSGFTTGVVIEKDGTLRPVPTKTVTINGKKYAAIFSRTNSVYTLASKSVSFDDMEGHWAKEAVNDMASRMIISGAGNNKFAPGLDITRAEFAAIVVRALGLKATDSVGFTDVKSGSWYYGAVAAAYKYGIVSGYGGGTFKPDSKITRQEAMAMTARAMKVAGMDTTITNEATAAELAKFLDGGSFSDWARQPAAAVIRSGLAVGSEGYARPERNITRAETAAIVRRLLEKAGLI